MKELLKKEAIELELSITEAQARIAHFDSKPMSYFDCGGPSFLGNRSPEENKTAFIEQAGATIKSAQERLEEIKSALASEDCSHFYGVHS